MQARLISSPKSSWPCRKSTLESMENPVLSCSDPQLLREILDRLRQLQHLGFAQPIDLLMQQLDLELGLDVDLVVVFCLLAIDVLLSVLAHHDEGRGIGRLERQRQVQENKGIGIPLLHISGDVENDPDQQDDRLDDD